MSETHDAAVLQALLDRLTRFRLPRLLALRKRVDAGERLTDEDIAFLKSAMEDAKMSEKYVVRNPRFHELGAQIAQAYAHIVQKATENESGPAHR